MWFSKKPKRLNLALQGGGAHGAFTWGVLDQLLLDEEISIAGISGTSAGSFNAVAIAHGLARGGRGEAREVLRAIWEEVQQSRIADLLKLNPMLSSFARSASALGAFSPYSFNPLGFDPLRKLLERHIDFDAIRANQSLDLVIAATDVATGKARLFRRHEISVDVVLASACLPTLHHAVMIDGRAYWDGGFSANPDLLTLAVESDFQDTLLIVLNPRFVAEMPRSANAIEARVSTISFNQPFLSAVATVVRAKETQLGWLPPKSSATARMKLHRFHLIEAGEHTASLEADTKILPDKDVLQGLYHAGIGEGERWLSAHKDAIGRKETVDLRAHFLEPTTAAIDAGDRRVPGEEPLARTA